MKKLIILLLISCTPKQSYVWKEEEIDTFYISDYDRHIIEKIYNAERMCDIFPSDTIDEGPSYDEYFK